MYIYYTAGLTQAKPIPTQNAVAYTYMFAQNQGFVIYDINNTMKPYLQAGNQFLDVEKLLYFTKEGYGKILTNEEAAVKGLLWLEPGRQTVIFIPPELENSLFTQMFFFEGTGLQNFEYIDSWGGEVKLYKVKLDTNLTSVT
jgi:hypothetical protein